MSTSRVIQIPIDEELLADLDQLTKAADTSRSAIIRLACREYIRRSRERELDETYGRGYERVPEDTDLAKAQQKIADRILPKESW